MKGKKKEILTASAVLLQKFATALANVAWLVLLAELIDEVLPQKVIMRSQEIAKYGMFSTKIQNSGEDIENSLQAFRGLCFS